MTPPPPLSRGARAIVLSGGVAMNLLLAVTLCIASAWCFGVAEPIAARVGPHADVTLPASLAPWAALRAGDLIVAVDGTCVVDWGEAGRHLVAAMGTTVTLTLATGRSLALPTPATMDDRARLLARLAPEVPLVVLTVTRGSAAAAGGLRVGDHVLRLNGVPVADVAGVDTVLRRVSGEAGAPSALTLDVQSGTGAPRAIRLRPRWVPDDAGGRRAILGMTVGRPRRAVAFSSAVAVGVHETGAMMRLLTRGLGQLAQRLMGARHGEAQMGSVILIGQMSGDAAHRGVEAFLLLMAFVSLNIGLLNLVPIPVLDGGQLLVLAVEGVRGRPLAAETHRVVMATGMACLVGLSILGVGSDLLRLAGF
jgi:regulator of sigma E protease